MRGSTEEGIMKFGFSGFLWSVICGVVLGPLVVSAGELQVTTLPTTPHLSDVRSQ